MQRYQEWLVSLNQKGQVVWGRHGGAPSLVGPGLSEFLPLPPWPARLPVWGASPMVHFPGRTRRHFSPCERKPAHLNSGSWLWRKMPRLSPDRLSRAAILSFQGWADFSATPTLLRAPGASPLRGRVPSLPRSGLAFLSPPGPWTTMRLAGWPSCSSARPGNHGNRRLQECALIEGRVSSHSDEQQVRQK